MWTWSLYDAITGHALPTLRNTSIGTKLFLLIQVKMQKWMSKLDTRTHAVAKDTVNMQEWWSSTEIRVLYIKNPLSACNTICTPEKIIRFQGLLTISPEQDICLLNPYFSRQIEIQEALQYSYHSVADNAALSYCVAILHQDFTKFEEKPQFCKS